MEFELDIPILSLVRQACQLGALKVGGPLSDAETLVTHVSEEIPQIDDHQVETLHRAILNDEDPLGTSYAQLRDRRVRRRAGLFYTDRQIVHSMVSWIFSLRPDRVVDAGCGSGRFALAVARKKADIPILAIDTDPVATILCRANLSVGGTRNARVLNEDFTQASVPSISGRTAFLGNPPYVRHHELTSMQKVWVDATSKRIGHKISKLAGLHTHFFLATAEHAKLGDVGCYITNAEWLDTNYGVGLKGLLLDGLGVESLHLFEHTSVPFLDAMTTAIITCFEVGRKIRFVRFKTVRTAAELQELRGGRQLGEKKLSPDSKWGQHFRNGSEHPKKGYMPLGDFARVHRGAVTGCNRFYVMSRRKAEERGLSRFVKPVLTSAQEVLQSGGIVRASSIERVVLAPPREIDLRSKDSAALVQYLREGEQMGVPSTYVCSHRRPWWNIGLRQAPPIVATYMARQAPAFALNPDGILILNVIHGIFPDKPLDWKTLEKFVHRLNTARAAFRRNGRFYHGGLQKLEPREMESLLIPSPY